MPVTSPWTIYNAARRHLMDGGFDLDGDTFMMSLFTGSSNAASLSLTRIADVTNEVANGNGYTTGGKVLTGVTWDVGAVPSEMRFNCAPAVWTASGGSIANVLFAVIWRRDVADPALRYVLAYCRLNDNPLDVTDGNPLSIDPGVNGIFELN